MKKSIFTFLFLFLFVLSSALAQTCAQCNAGTTVGNDYSSALGKDNTSTGSASFTAGKSNTADTTYTIAIGSYTSASGKYATTLGRYLSASGENSMVIGSGASSIMNLSNSNSNSLMIGFGSANPTLFVGAAPSQTKTGKIGIGNITSPSAKLHLKADDREDAIFLIEPNSWSTGNLAEIQYGASNNKIRGSFDTGMEFSVDGHYYFQDGNVGIGLDTDSVPDHKLEVAHSNNNGGMVLNNVMLGDTNYHSQIYFNKNGVEKWSIGNDIYRKGKQDFFIWDHENGRTRFIIDSLGRVGIDTNKNISYKLSVNTDTLSGILVKTNYGNHDYKYCIHAKVDNSKTKALVVSNNDTTNFLVYGDGSVRAREVIVKVGSLGDFVFDEGYKLPGILEMEAFIDENHHLPGIPTADEVAKDGMNVGEFQNLLLQKVEEQALYIIQLQKQLNSLSAQVEQLTKSNH